MIALASINELYKTQKEVYENKTDQQFNEFDKALLLLIGSCRLFGYLQTLKNIGALEPSLKSDKVNVAEMIQEQELLRKQLTEKIVQYTVNLELNQKKNEES
jgi:hypothetical protein